MEHIDEAELLGSMPLVRRNRQPNQDSPPPIQNEDAPRRKKWSLDSHKFKSVTSSLLCIAACFVVVEVWGWSGGVTSSGTKGKENIFRREIADNVILAMDFDRQSTTRGDQSETELVTLGPHRVTVSVKSGCENQRIWIGLYGDVLVSISLRPEGPLSLSGNFSVPFDGSYSVRVLWYGCEGSSSSNSLLSPLELTAQGRSNSTMSPSSAIVGTWMTSSKFNISTPSFLWTITEETPTTLLPAKSGMGDSLVVKEATPISNGFQRLSNYEIVCWIGTASAASMREAFLSLRPHIASQQRPFKFHYHNVTDFEHPDQHWDEGEKSGFRKCKIVVVSVDAVDKPLSQADYKTQVKTFLGHLVKALDDETFPIWMTTVNTPPFKESSMCHSRTTWSTDHPCNDALRDLFRESSLPNRVHLMDNTDLSNHMDIETKDVIAVIAMRIFALIGSQVDDWRARDQMGTKEGLHRGNKLEPNTPLVPYDWK